MKITVQTNYVAVLVFHCLAHMKVENDSDLYSKAYINEINKEKQQSVSG